MTHATTERMRPRNGSAWSELEQIVAGLFDAMEQAVAPRRPQARRAEVELGGERRPEAAGGNQHPPRAGGERAAQDGAAPGAQGLAAGDLDARPDAPRPAIGPNSADRAEVPTGEAEIVTIGNPHPIQRPVDILLPEEEAFVASTVVWLTSRPNPEIVLERIRSMLVPLQEAEEEATAGLDLTAEPAAGWLESATGRREADWPSDG